MSPENTHKLMESYMEVLTLRGRITDAVETMCMTMWCICRVAGTSIRKLSYVVLLPAYKHSGNIVIHSTTVVTVTLLHACKWLYYTGITSL